MCLYDSVEGNDNPESYGLNTSSKAVDRMMISLLAWVCLLLRTSDLGLLQEYRRNSKSLEISEELCTEELHHRRNPGTLVTGNFEAIIAPLLFFRINRLGPFRGRSRWWGKDFSSVDIDR